MESRSHGTRDFDDNSWLPTLESEARMGRRGVVGKSKLDFEATPSCVEWHVGHRSKALRDLFHQIGGCGQTLGPSERIEQRNQFRWTKDRNALPLVQDDDSRSAAQFDA